MVYDIVQKEGILCRWIIILSKKKTERQSFGCLSMHRAIERRGWLESFCALMLLILKPEQLLRIELLTGMGNHAGDNVAHFAHLGGMLIGLVLIIYWRKKGKIHGPYNF